MNPVAVIWILAVVVAVLVGREVGRWLFGQNAKLQEKKKAAQVLATELRANGLRLIPSVLDDFVRADVADMIEKVHEVGKLVEAGSDAIKRELQGVYERVLDAKLKQPEGLALIKAKIASLEAPPAESATSPAKS